MFIYKHKVTGDLVTRLDSSGPFFFMENGKMTAEAIRAEVVYKGDDWTLVKNGYTLILEDGKIAFQSNTTGAIFRIGDKFTIAPGHKFGDGKRNFVSKAFYISDSLNSATNCFEFVYFKTTDDKDVHLNDVVQMN